MVVQLPQIRKAQIEDAPAYRVLRLAALQDHPVAFGGDPHREAMHPLAYWQNRLDPAANPTSATFVADADGKLVGMIVVVQMQGAKLQHTAHIYSVYVSPPWRGHGVADALLAACVSWGQEHGIQQLKLSVAAGNVAALACYLRNQFRVYGVDPHVICVDDELHDELLLMRSLAVSM